MIIEVGRVCDVSLAREAGLPHTALDILSMPNTTVALAEMHAAAAACDAVRDELSEHIYAAVSVVDEAPLRRSMIALRRDVHNGRLRDKHSEVARRMNDLPVWTGAAALDTWIEQCRRRDAARERATSAYPREAGAVADNLRATLLDGPIFDTLVLASHEFAAALRRRPLAASGRSRGTRSAVSYLGRIVTKCSPFGSFTTVRAIGAAASETTRVDQAEVDQVETVTSSRAVAVALLFGAALDHAAVDLAPLPVYDESGRPRVVTTRRVLMGRSSTRLDEVAYVDTDEATGAVSAPRPATVERLIESGLLVPVVDWDLQARSQFDGVHNLLRRRCRPDSATLRAAEVLQSCAHDLDSGLDRLAALAEARRAVAELPRRRVDGVVADPSQLTAFHSTVSRPTLSGPVPAAAAETIRTVARTLADATVLDPGYTALRNHFVRTYGHSSSGIPLDRFVLGCRGGLDSSLDIRTGTTDMDVMGTVAPPTYSIIVRADRSSRIVEQALCCAPGQLTRWSISPRIADTMVEVESWLTSRTPDTDVVMYAMHSDTVDMQRIPPTSFGAVSLPGDLHGTGKRTSLSDYTIGHDSSSNTLQIVGPSGIAVTFVDVGSVPRHLQTGAALILGLLSEPWVLTRHPGRDRRLRDDGRFGYSERLVVDGVIWGRARWSFDPRTVPRPEAASSEVDFLASMARWRLENSLPDDVFVTRVFRSPFGTRTSKPQWAGFDYPFAVIGAFSAIPDDCSAIDVTEALPSPVDADRVSSGAEYHATEYHVLVATTTRSAT